MWHDVSNLCNICEWLTKWRRMVWYCNTLLHIIIDNCFLSKEILWSLWTQNLDFSFLQTHRSAHSGVFRISKRGAKCSLATSAHTKGGPNQVFQFFYCQQKIFFGQRGHGRFGQEVNRPLSTQGEHFTDWATKTNYNDSMVANTGVCTQKMVMFESLPEHPERFLKNIGSSPILALLVFLALLVWCKCAHIQVTDYYYYLLLSILVKALEAARKWVISNQKCANSEFLKLRLWMKLTLNSSHSVQITTAWALSAASYGSVQIVTSLDTGINWNTTVVRKLKPFMIILNHSKLIMIILNYSWSFF